MQRSAVGRKKIVKGVKVQPVHAGSFSLDGVNRRFFSACSTSSSVGGPPGGSFPSMDLMLGSSTVLSVGVTGTGVTLDFPRPTTPRFFTCAGAVLALSMGASNPVLSTGADSLVTGSLVSIGRPKACFSATLAFSSIFRASLNSFAFSFNSWMMSDISSNSCSVWRMIAPSVSEGLSSTCPRALHLFSKMRIAVRQFSRASGSSPWSCSAVALRKKTEASILSSLFSSDSSSSPARSRSTIQAS
mmetsp:Transcript_5571/g.34545  ORF Transcript_5571/g.34545 Transcript_5571/m.34545 type:complete len:244 (-) Transcript_5571:545-1276(-)